MFGVTRTWSELKMPGKTEGRITGSGYRNYCIASFPATFGATCWDNLVSTKMDYACCWTGDPNSATDEWFDPWKVNVRNAEAKGMELLVFVHEKCSKLGGVTKRHNGLPFRLGDGQVKELQWLNAQGIKYKVYCSGAVVKHDFGACRHCNGWGRTGSRKPPFFKRCHVCDGSGQHSSAFDKHAYMGPIHIDRPAPVITPKKPCAAASHYTPSGRPALLGEIQSRAETAAEPVVAEGRPVVEGTAVDVPAVSGVLV